MDLRIALFASIAFVVASDVRAADTDWWWVNVAIDRSGVVEAFYFVDRTDIKNADPVRQAWLKIIYRPAHPEYQEIDTLESFNCATQSDRMDYISIDHQDGRLTHNENSNPSWSRLVPDSILWNTMKMVCSFGTADPPTVGELKDETPSTFANTYFAHPERFSDVIPLGNASRMSQQPK